MKMERAIREFLIEIEVRKYTAKTQKLYKNNLYLFLRFLQENTETAEIEDLTMGDIKRFISYMNEKGRKGTYINGILRVIKSFVQYCYDEGYGGFNTRKMFKWCKEDKPVITAFKPEDIKHMINNCSGSGFLNLRDKAIITMFVETGIRNFELCNIQKHDIHEDYIIINGKNHKQRVVPITPVLRKALLKYETEKEDYFALKNIDDYYFLSFHGRKLTCEANEHILKKRGEGITGIRVSPHTCRHFFAQQHVRMGTDLYTISRLLGHENIQITQTYLDSLRDEDVIQIAKNRSVLMNMK